MPEDPVEPDIQVKPPFDQPGLVAVLKSKVAVGWDGGNGSGGGSSGGDGGGEGGGGEGGGGEGGGEGGESGEGGEGGNVNSAGGVGGEGGDGGEGGVGSGKQSSQPALVTLPSVRHSIGVPAGTAPSGELVPQYWTLFTVRRSHAQDEWDSTSKVVTEIGTAGGLVIVQASLLE